MNGHHVGREREQIVTTNEESYKAKEMGVGNYNEEILAVQRPCLEKRPSSLPTTENPVIQIYIRLRCLSSSTIYCSQSLFAHLKHTTRISTRVRCLYYSKVLAIGRHTQNRTGVVLPPSSVIHIIEQKHEILWNSICEHNLS
jgi:hypothetical protein